MDGLKQVSMALATAGLMASGVAQAALNDRGGGLVYDDVLNVTWLQDASYAMTHGYDGNGYGLNTWNAANTWAANLSFHDSVRNVDLTGWRLPTTAPVGADWNYSSQSNDGSTDIGYNITSPHSELSYMYYVNLGLKGYFSSTGVFQPDCGVMGNCLDGAYLAKRDVGLVKNLRNGVYWSGTAYSTFPNEYAWAFNTSYGGQSPATQNGYFLAWAVRPGDVAAVPEPETYAMLLAGLGLLGFMARRKKQQSA